MRLQKFLAQAGIASRRKSEEHIINGRVKVNNVTVTELGTKIDPETDVVLYNDKKVEKEENKVYYMLNKPTGYITTIKDEQDRKTVVDLFPEVSQRIYPVGRLDCDTTGLLILTNDGEITYRITHPKYEIEKTYIAKVRGIPSAQALEEFRQGLLIDGRKTAKAKIKIMNQEDDDSVLQISIIEGRNRQVRKMCSAIGHPVLLLSRISIGEISLGDLPIGKSRQLSTKEIDYLRKI